ncbi:MAG: hypothetical protein R2705_12605 [Ilumatobacteraceae bacterium]
MATTAPILDNPFLLGVASGDPLPRRRDALDPVAGTDLPEEVPVVAEASLDDQFTEVIT